MKKKISQIIILVSLIVFLFLPIPLWKIIGGNAALTNNENRSLTEKPVFKLDSYESYPSEYEKYLNDSIPFRNQYIELNSSIDYFLFNRSSNAKVIKGKEQWLFYDNVNDGDPLGCYKGENLLSDEELKSLAQKLIKIDKELKSQDKDFVLMIVPNKERVYSEYLPEYYGSPADINVASQIYDYLSENTEIKVVYPYSELIESKEKCAYDLYYKSDTHWNWLGGYVGASQLLGKLSVEIPPVDSADLSFEENGNYSGDLAAMLNMKNVLSDIDKDYSIKGYGGDKTTVIQNDFNGVFEYQTEGADERSIYIIRDSFCTHMAPYIGASFSRSYMRHRGSYSYDELKDVDADIVVYEAAERYVKDLLNFEFIEEK